jgi:hypothetical protein
MRRRNEPAELTRIAAIRELQRASAEAKAAAAASVLRETERVQSASTRARAVAEEGWRQSLETDSFRVEATALWSAALMREEQGVIRATVAVERAQSDVTARATDWNAATLRRDAADDMARDAVRAAARAREDDAVQDASDRHAQRKAGP